MMKKFILLLGLVCLISADFWDGKFKVTSSCKKSYDCCCARKNTNMFFSTNEDGQLVADNKTFDDVDACESLGWDFDNQAVFPWDSFEEHGEYTDADGIVYTFDVIDVDRAIIFMDQSALGLSDNCAMTVTRA